LGPLVFACWVSTAEPARAAIRYVDQSAAGTNNGTSWANAYRELQSALIPALSGDQIWVAAGTYLPDYDVNTATHTLSRTASFQLKSGVALYGGFSPGGGDGTFLARNPAAYETILSGDLNGDDETSGDSTENSYHVIFGNSVDSTSLVDGFTIVAGNANDSSHDEGGGIRIYSGNPIVRDCLIARNEAIFGGGISVYSGQPLITDCDFIDNTSFVATGVGGWGGGVYTSFCNSGLQITRCAFIGNYARWGGALFNFTSSPTLSDCFMSENSVLYDGGAVENYRTSNPTYTGCIFTHNHAFGGGGMTSYTTCSPTVTNCVFETNSTIEGGTGMLNEYGSNSLVVGCIFRNNVAGDLGAGMFNRTSNPTVTNCIFTGNTAPQKGGGMHNRDDSSPIVTGCVFTGNYAGDRGGGMQTELGNPVVINCSFSGNHTVQRGGGMQTVSGNPVLTNCTFSGNYTTDVSGQGGAIQTDTGSPALANCILWNNSDWFGVGQSSQIAGETPTVDHSCIQGWNGSLGGIGNTGAIPFFVDADGPDNMIGTTDDNLRLALVSPLIDAGDNAAIQATGVTLDLDGHARRVQQGAVPDTGSGTAPIVDMGAYETPGDCNGNGQPDETDPDADGDGVIDDCEACPGDLDRDGDVDMTDFGGFQLCHGMGPSLVCAEADINHDYQVNQTDAAIIIKCMSGANVPCNLDCAN